MISFKILTPFGDIPVHTTYDAAAGLADLSADSKPVQLTNGYYIAPETPATENFNAITGLPPFYVAVQGEQVFAVYNSDGSKTGGSFRGYVSTTADLLGFSSEAILVAENLTGTVGTAAGQVPPVGSVYNVIYFAPTRLFSTLPCPRHPARDLVQIGDALRGPARLHRF